MGTAAPGAMSVRARPAAQPRRSAPARCRKQRRKPAMRRESNGELADVTLNLRHCGHIPKHSACQPGHAARCLPFRLLTRDRHLAPGTVRKRLEPLLRPTFPTYPAGSSTGANGQTVSPDAYLELSVSGDSSSDGACNGNGELSFTVQGSFCGSVPNLAVTWPANVQTSGCMCRAGAE